MRRRRTEDEGSLDSLLDTMTNVVGILVIVLVVTQLGVGEAVKRIGKSIDVATLAAAEEKLIEVERENTRLTRVVSSAKDSAIQDPAAELEAVQRQLNQRLQDLEQAQRAADEQQAAAREAAAERERVDEQEKELRKQLALALEQKATPRLRQYAEASRC